MADAVLTQRLLVGGAALALLFLVALSLVVGFWVLARVVKAYRSADLDAPDTVDPVHVHDVGVWLDSYVISDPHLAAFRDRLQAAERDERRREAP